MDNEPVHHDFNRMFLILFHGNGFRQIVNYTVYPNAGKPAPAGGIQFLHVLSLAGTHPGSQHKDFGSLRQGKHLIDNLVDGLLPDFPAADRAVRDSNARIQKPQIIINFCYRAHRGARIF